MLRLLTLAVLAAFCAGTPAFSQTTPPVVPESEPKQPLPTPYRSAADAHTNVAAAFQRARRSGKRVLIELGGNWCPDCRMFAGVTALPEIHAFLKQHFEIVVVDVGHADKNLDIPAQYGGSLHGVPTVLAVTPEGVLLNKDEASQLSNARSMKPQAIADWLAQWAQPARR